MPVLHSVGHIIPRDDAYDKVSGRTEYVADMKLPGMLFGKVLHSPYAHADITSIDVSAAEALPGVKAVVTWRDAPQIPFTTCGHPHPADTPLDTLILSRRLRYAGEPVAAVAAVSKEIAADALDLIKVEYETLPFYISTDDSLAVGAVNIHDSVPGNVAGRTEYSMGDVDAQFTDPDLIIVEDEFRTPVVTHSPIETHVSLVDIDLKGRLTFYVSNQVPNILRERLSVALDMPMRKIRVVKKTIGGSFGGKQEPVYEQLNGLLTLKAQKPVMLEITREEEIATTRTRHSGTFRFRTAVTADGCILAREMEAVQNTGAYSSHGHNVMDNIAGQFPVLYPSPNLRFKGLTVYTNMLVAGAMRGYGIPQYAVTNESHMDHVARTIGMDPLAFRLKNAYRLGDDIGTDAFSLTTCGLPELMEKAADAIGYDKFRSEPQPEGPVRRGIGMSLSSYGSTCFPHSVELSSATMTIHEDASATLLVGCIDSGQGSATAMRQIAAEAAGIPAEWVTVYEGDTDINPFDVGEYASRQTYVSGFAVKKAGLKCRRQILERAADILKIPVDDLDTSNGSIIRKSTGQPVSSMRDVTMKTYYNFRVPESISHHAFHCPTANVLTFGVSFALVNVDTRTGKVEVEKIVTSLDCGKLINPQTAEAQMTGGCTMSFGYGMMEQVLIDKKTGRVHNDSMLDYKIPSFADIPDIDWIFVETDEPTSAYGNKSLGEPPSIAPAAALKNAVYDATGVLLNETPLTPERVYMAILAEKSGGSFVSGRTAARSLGRQA